MLIENTDLATIEDKQARCSCWWREIVPSRFYSPLIQSKCVILLALLSLDFALKRVLVLPQSDSFVFSSTGNALAVRCPIYGVHLVIVPGQVDCKLE